MKRFMISSALLLCIMLSVSVAPQAVAQNTVWMQRVVPGRFYNDNSEGSKIQIRCIPEDNRICAVIYIQIDASNDPIDRVPGNYGLRAGVGTGDSSRVGLWIPDLNQGYCRVRFDGMLWNSGDNALGIYLHKETTTHHVESKQVLEQCLGIND